MAILTGEYRHQIDEKNRIRIPAKLKEVLGANPMIAKGSNGCLIVMSKDRAESLMEKIFNADDLSDNPNTRAMRMMLSSADFPEEDKQGRIQIKSTLLAKTSIKKNLVTIGLFDRVEIWSEEAWEAYLNDEEQPDFDTCLRSLNKNA